MIQEIYVIKDRKSGQISPLFFVPNQDTAERQFGLFLSGNPVPANDFNLYRVGYIDTESAVPKIDSQNVVDNFIANGSEIDIPERTEK